MSITVRPVTTRQDRRAWIRFPRLEVYREGSPWVPPPDRDLARMLNRKKNPFFQYGEAEALIAWNNDGRIVGRVLAHVYRRHEERYHDGASFFGYFECTDSREAAVALIDAARAFGRRHGCTLLRGPFNMTAMQEMGILIDGFDEAPAVDETYTAPYYPSLLEAAGLTRVFPVTTFRVDDLSSLDPHSLLTQRHRDLLEGGKLRLRPADLKHFDRELEILRDLLNDSFNRNPHFVPITAEEFSFQIGPYRRLLDPKISLVAEMEGEPAAFVVTVPNFNLVLKPMNGSMGPRALWTFFRGRSKIHDAALIIMGVREGLQGGGVMRIILSELVRALIAGGYERLTITWIADVNDKSLGSVHALGGRPLHRLTLYEGPTRLPAT